VGLASFAGAAQPEEAGNHQGKKKGGGNAPVQQAVVQPTTTGKIHGQKYNANANYKVTNKNARMIHDPTLNQGGGSLSTAKSTSFNKTAKFNKTVNKNITVNNYKVQKFNLSNKPIAKYQAVKFNQNYQIAGAHNWKGSKYVVFQNYHPQWHDQGWWHHHHNHIVFVFGAPYYWDSGYYYPAWGYYPTANYYYDGPIYASSPEIDPGQEVANVQAALQQQGFYQGEIDGVLGPQTRAALAEYQSAQGLEPTGAIDEPTAEALGIA
jgi:hypothetical protein